MLAFVTAADDETVALETAVCRGARGCSSDGIDPGELANREAPSSGFLPDDLDLSTSGGSS